MLQSTWNNDKSLIFGLSYLKEAKLSDLIEKCSSFCPSSSLFHRNQPCSQELQGMLRIYSLAWEVLHELTVGLQELPGVWYLELIAVSELLFSHYINSEMSWRSFWSYPRWALMPCGGCSLALVWLWSPAPQLRAHMKATTAVAVGLPCHIHLHAWAPLTVASASLHAGNKAHRKCTQSECSALHCCHSFCPQGDHCSVQQPSRPLLLREHPDLQQCGGDKNITWGPGAQQAVSIFLLSLPGPPEKGFRDTSSLPRYQVAKPRKALFQDSGSRRGTSVDDVPRGRALRSGECFMRWRHEINAVVSLCLAETDAVSVCVHHIPARWSEQVPDSLLQALPTVSVCASFTAVLGRKGTN